MHKARNTNTNEVVAVKCTPIEKFRKNAKLLEFTNNEIEILEKTNHPHIITYIERLDTVNNLYMIYEYCNGGTLESKIYSHKGLSENECLTYFSQILSSMAFLE